MYIFVAFKGLFNITFSLHFLHLLVPVFPILPAVPPGGKTWYDKAIFKMQQDFYEHYFISK